MNLPLAIIIDMTKTCVVIPVYITIALVVAISLWFFLSPRVSIIEKTAVICLLSGLWLYSDATARNWQRVTLPDGKTMIMDLYVHGQQYAMITSILGVFLILGSVALAVFDWRRKRTKIQQCSPPMSNPKPKPKAKWWQGALFIPLAPVLLVVVVLALLFFLVFTVCLHIAIWSWWCIRGRDILFVYSDSPIWHAYIEQHVLPHLGERAVVLNWSQRKGWRFSLARMAVHHFGGWREFNPLGVVFRPFRRTRTFRFWQPFRDFKHGHPEALHRMESEFFGLIGVQRHDPSV